MQAPGRGPSASPAAPPPRWKRRTGQIGHEILDLARRHRGGLFSTRFWSNQLVLWAMKDPALRVQLFRFVDVFPMLRSPAQVHDYLVDHLLQPGVKLPPGLDVALKVGGLAKGLLADAITAQIRGMAGHLIAGADAAAALPVLEKLWHEGIAFSVDLLGEAV